jgi:hypothetical protein
MNKIAGLTRAVKRFLIIIIIMFSSWFSGKHGPKSIDTSAYLLILLLMLRAFLNAPVSSQPNIAAGRIKKEVETFSKFKSATSILVLSLMPSASNFRRAQEIAKMARRVV